MVLAIAIAIAALSAAPAHALEGAIVQKAGTAGCVSEDTTGGACADGLGMGWLRDHADAFRAALATGASRPAD